MVASHPAADAELDRPLAAWIFNHYAAEPGQPAGTRHYDLAVRMRALGITTTIFASGFSHFSRRDEKVHGVRLWRTEVVDGVRFVWVRTPSYARNDLRRVLSMLAYGVVAGVAQIGMRAPDVIIGSTVHPFAALSARVVSRLRRRPFVFEIRDLWPQTLIDMGAMPERSVGARALYGIERRLVKGADAVISLLPGVSEYFASRSLTPRRLAYIPNGTPIGNGPADPAPARFVRIVEGWRADGAIVFGYVGAHGKANGLDTVLEAMTRLRRQGHAGIKLVLVGDGPEKDRLRQASVAAGLEGAVEFMDPVAKRAMPSVLGLFDAGVFHLDPNPVFRFGISSNKLFDYLGGGLPVVFACSGGYDPVAQANAGITIPPRDAGAMADAMLQIAGLSKEKRASMGDRARVYVKDEHDLDTLALRLADLLREVAGAAPTRRAS